MSVTIGSKEVQVAAPMPRLPAWAGDLAAAVVIVGSSFFPTPDVSGDHAPLGYVVVLLPAALVPLRHRYPRVMLGLCLVCYGVAAMTVGITPFSAIACAVGVYTTAVGTDRRESLATAAVVAAVTASLAAVSVGGVLDPLVLLVLLLTGFAFATGETARVRRAYLTELAARAHRAERTREVEASRRVAEDRLRIARDLHDTVAHQITVISLHSGVASANIEKSPDLARESLQTIRRAARTVLGEIGDLLATLRSTEEVTRPARAPGLADLSGLLEGFTRSGLEVSSSVAGDIDRLTPAADLVAYRVIQEGLTNALRHGAGQVSLSIVIGPAAAELAITNPVGNGLDHNRTGPGHGLAGITERVTAVRGQTNHGSRDGHFQLAVTLPTSHTGSTERW